MSASGDSSNSRTIGAGLVVKKARIIPENKDNCDLLRVVAEGQNKEGKPVSLKYEWIKNSEYASDGDHITGFKRGDIISVRITPFEGTNYGLTRVVTAEIKNCNPKLTESRQISFDGKVLIYQVKAVDPDGDPLTYSLMDAPPGMTIDKNNGLIKWVVPDNVSGNQSVKVEISDNAGGKLIYTLNTVMSDAAK